MIFRNQGADLFATQVVNLPVRSLCENQVAGQKAKLFKVALTPFEPEVDITSSCSEQ